MNDISFNSSGVGLANLLIVDDELDRHRLLADMLGDQPYALSMTTTIEAAWAVLSDPSQTIDAILLDRGLAGADGLALLQKIKLDPRLRYTPVILQTGYSAPEDIAEGIREGAFYYLVKPYTPKLLLSVVATALRDAQEHRVLLSEIDEHHAAFQLMAQGEFFFRSLNEARTLGAYVAGACPDPGRVVIGLTEILINAVEHGNLQINYELKTELCVDGTWEAEVERRLGLPNNSDKRAKLGFFREETGVRIVVEDQGSGFDWQRYDDLDFCNINGSHGRGICLARALSFDSLQYLGNGNRVEMWVFDK